MSYLKTRKKLS